MSQPDLVLANLEWVRALAVKLVGDAASADDLVQEAWLAARSGQPASWDGGGPRPWLAGLLRNLARGKFRQGQSRRTREQRAARPESTGLKSSPDQLVARSEQLTSVARHVLALDEPYRRTMLLRWFDGVSSEEIARKEGIKLATVRTRLHRGRAELKARLDEENGGDSRPWALALMPFVLPKAQGPAVKLSSSAKMTAAAAAVVTMTGASIWMIRDDASAKTPDPARTVLAGGPEVADDGDDRLVELVSVSHRQELNEARPSEAAPSLPDLAVEGHPLFGRVALVNGEPVRNALVTAISVEVEPSAKAVSTSVHADEDGRFSFEGLEQGRYRIGVSTVVALDNIGETEFATGDEEHQITVDAYAVRLRAVDASGTPVPMVHAEVRSMPIKDESGTGSFGRGQGFEVPKLQHFFTIESLEGHRFHAKDAEGRIYHGMVTADRSIGRVDLDLTEDAPEFGSITARLDHVDLPDGAIFTVRASSRDGRMVSVFAPDGVASDGGASVNLTGLLPGDYSLSFDLRKARPLALARSGAKVHVDAGGSASVDAEVYVGGMIELHVNTGDPVPVGDDGKALRAEVSYREIGDLDWDFILMQRDVSGEEFVVSGTESTRRVPMDGSESLSFPQVEGEYELRVAAEGFQPVVTKVRILPGATERVEVDLALAE